MKEERCPKCGRMWINKRVVNRVTTYTCIGGHSWSVKQ